MRSFKRCSKGRFTAGMLAVSMLGLGACGPDYALFKVSITTKDPSSEIEECRMTITDEKGSAVLDHFLLKTVAGSPDSQGNSTLLQGCQGGMTKSNIGLFSYSSSRTTGTLTFQVDAYNSTAANGGQKVIETGNSGPVAPAAYPPEVTVSLEIK